MLASDLIRILQHFVDEHQDLPVVLYDDDNTCYYYDVGEVNLLETGDYISQENRHIPDWKRGSLLPFSTVLEIRY